MFNVRQCPKQVNYDNEMEIRFLICLLKKQRESGKCNYVDSTRVENKAIVVPELGPVPKFKKTN